MIVKKQIVQRQPLSNLSESSLDPLINRIYANRGIKSLSQLDYSLKNLPRPDLLTGMKEACELLYEAVLADANILIVGDYDVDGATSTTLTKLSLESFGFNHVAYFIPDRLTFGYGLSTDVVEAIQGFQADVLITVDNGISSHEGIKLAHEYGISVIVTDHHLPGTELPQADAIINPNLPGDKFPAKSLAGVGVAFYLMLGLRAFLRSQNWFKENDLKEPPMVDLLDLVALGTIADVVPFEYVNRLLVHQGLTRIRQGKCNLGIKTLIDQANCQLDQIGSEDIAFKIAPKINAAGRLEDMSIGVECLLSEDAKSANHFAEKLDHINEQRKTEQKTSSEQALDQISNEIDEDDYKDKSTICLYRKDWHPGIVGLIASRLKDGFNLPSIIFADDNTKLKGSARSTSGLHIRDILASIASKNPGLIEKYGGHAMAAGLTISYKDFDEFQMLFEQTVQNLTNGLKKAATLLSDGELDSDDFQLSTVALIDNAGPWGQHFDQPLFDNEFIVKECREIGKTGGHLRFLLAHSQDHSRSIQAVAFNVDRYYDLSNLNFTSIQAIFKLDTNRYNNSHNLQIIIDYFKVKSD